VIAIIISMLEKVALYNARQEIEAILISATQH